MIRPESMRALEEIHALQSVPFIRYVVETSGVEARDEIDRKALALYEEWCRASVEHLESLRDFLHQQGAFSGSGSWDLAFSQFNYVSASHVLREVIARMGRHLDSVEALSRALDDWPEAKSLVLRFVATERCFLGRAAALEAERPRPAPAPARIKGTSAARW